MSLAAVRIGAVDLGIGNVLGSNLFNLLILGLDDVFYRQGPLMADAGASHTVSMAAIVMMNALFLIGLTYKVMTSASSWRGIQEPSLAFTSWRLPYRTC